MVYLWTLLTIVFFDFVVCRIMWNYTNDMTEWRQQPDRKKCLQWRDLVSGGTMYEKLSINMRVFFHHLACYMERLCQECLDAVQQRIGRTMDPRYIHQLSQLENYIQDHQRGCQEIVSLREGFKERKRSPYWHMITKTESRMFFSAFFSSWVSDLYYAWKSCKKNNRLASFVNGHVSFSFDDIQQWEVICADEEEEILAHPLLSHPDDFLRRNKTVMGDRYADKARFEYYFQGKSLQDYNVVLTETPSVIPKLIAQSHQEDRVVLGCQGGAQVQDLFRESTSGHRMGNKKRRKALSRILKETRKKKKASKRIEKNRDQPDIDNDDEYDDYLFYWYDYYYDDDDWY